MKLGRLFILLFTILLFLPGITKADEYIDSLQNVISRHLIENHVDSVLNTRLVLIKYVRFSDFELFLDLSKSNIELAKKENLNWGQIDTYMELGEVFILKGIFSEALNNLNEALKLAEIDEYRPYIGWVSISIGNAYEGMFAFNKAIDFYQKSFQVFEETDNTEGMALASTNVGSCYQELNELDKAEMFLTRGLKYYKQIDDPVNLGYVQMYLAELKIIRGKYNEAKSDLASLTYSVQELILNNKDASASNEAQNLLSVVLWLLSDCENHLGNTQKSISYLKDAVALNSKSGNFINLATFYNLLGNSYLAEKQYNLALVFADSAATIAKNERIFIEEAKSYQLFSNIYSGLNKPDKALNYYKQYKSINDSIYNNAVIQAISDVDVLVHTVEKEKDNQILALKYGQERKNRIIGATGTLVLFIIVSTFVFIINRRYTKEKKLRKQLLIQNGQIVEQSKNMERLNDELTLINKSKDKFNSIIAHDLKNPAATVYSLVNLLNQKYDDYPDKDRKELIKMADDMAERTVKLLENLLTWSQVQNGKLAVNYSEVSITDVLKENIELAERIALAKGLTLRLSPAGKIKIKADKEMITTVVRNLISNAIKFSSSGQTIYTGIKIFDHHIEVWVQDEGIGIPKNKLGTLFQIDSQIQRKGTNEEPGTGLGLQLCHEFISMHKGKINVTSEEGKGSRFTFSLPY